MYLTKWWRTNGKILMPSQLNMEPKSQDTKKPKDKDLLSKTCLPKTN